MIVCSAEMPRALVQAGYGSGDKVPVVPFGSDENDFIGFLLAVCKGGLSWEAMKDSDD